MGIRCISTECPNSFKHSDDITKGCLCGNLLWWPVVCTYNGRIRRRGAKTWRCPFTLPCAGSSQTQRTYVCSLASARRLSTARALWPRAMTLSSCRSCACRSDASWFVRTATALETASRTVEASRVQAPVASATIGLNRTPWAEHRRAVSRIRGS